MRSNTLLSLICCFVHCSANVISTNFFSNINIDALRLGPSDTSPSANKISSILLIESLDNACNICCFRLYQDGGVVLEMPFRASINTLPINQSFNQSSSPPINSLINLSILQPILPSILQSILQSSFDQSFNQSCN